MTVRSVFIVTVQLPVPGQEAAGLPVTVQPVNVEFPLGSVVNVIWVPLLTVSEQLLPQLMPGPVTLPFPAPVFVTISVRGTALKLAVTVRLASSVTVHVPVPGQVAVGLPVTVQPVKEEPVLAAAVRVSCVPLFAVCVQSLPQLMPVPVTVPVPLPVFVTVSVRWFTAKAAVTVRSAFMVKVQVLVPGQVAVGLPVTVQPVKVKLALGVAVNVIDVPLLTVEEHMSLLPQSMPGPVIEPLGFGVTVSVRWMALTVIVTVSELESWPSFAVSRRT